MVGKETDYVVLTNEDWSFIVSGLRDLADMANRRIVTHTNQEDMEMEVGIREHNLALASSIEEQVFSKGSV